MAEVWVPTEFHRNTFSASGVDPAKIQVWAACLGLASLLPSPLRPATTGGFASPMRLSLTPSCR